MYACMGVQEEAHSHGHLGWGAIYAYNLSSIYSNPKPADKEAVREFQFKISGDKNAQRLGFAFDVGHFHGRQDVMAFSAPTYLDEVCRGC